MFVGHDKTSTSWSTAMRMTDCSAYTLCVLWIYSFIKRKLCGWATDGNYTPSMNLLFINVFLYAMSRALSFISQKMWEHNKRKKIRNDRNSRHCVAEAHGTIRANNLFTAHQCERLTEFEPEIYDSSPLLRFLVLGRHSTSCFADTFFFVFYRLNLMELWSMCHGTTYRDVTHHD